MSISFDYFFNSDRELHQLSNEINEWLGCNLMIKETEPGREQAWCRFYGMSLDLYESPLQGDDFELFKYQIGLVGPSDVMNMALPVIATVAYLLYLRLDISDGSLIFDVQVPLTRYQEKLFDGYRNLFDAISGKEVEFPQHLVDIESLIS